MKTVSRRDQDQTILTKWGNLMEPIRGSELFLPPFYNRITDPERRKMHRVLARVFRYNQAIRVADLISTAGKATKEFMTRTAAARLVATYDELSPTTISYAILTEFQRRAARPLYNAFMALSDFENAELVAKNWDLEEEEISRAHRAKLGKAAHRK